MKYLKSILSVIVICVLLIIGISKMQYLFRPNDTDDAYRQIETFHSLPDNSLEVIIYGSSHAYRGVCTMELYNRYGIGAYNYGYHWQSLNTTKLFLKDSLLNQKPKVILLETFYVNSVLEDSDMTAEIYYSRYIKDKKAKEEYLGQCLGSNANIERRLSYRIPFCIFHENWESLNKQSFSKLTVGNAFRNSMGFFPSDKVSEIDIPDYTTFTQYDLSNTALNELNQIMNICRENNIQVVFFTVPWAGDNTFSNAMNNFALENNCSYLDLYEYVNEIGLDGSTDFSDYGHLNTSGAIKVADFLGQYLIENFELSDMREIDDNLWEIVGNTPKVA